MTEEKEDAASDSTNQKFSQPMRMIMINPDFLSDCQELRQRFEKLALEAVRLRAVSVSEREIILAAEKRFFDEYGFDVNAEIAQLAVKAKIDKKVEQEHDKWVSDINKKILEEIDRTNEEFHKARTKLLSNRTVEKAFEKLLQTYGYKYNLFPALDWYYALANFVFFGDHTFPTPSFELPDEVFADIISDPKGAALYSTVNFGLKMTINEITNEPELYIRLYKNTSKHDVVKGWRIIEIAQKLILKKSRHYPYKTLGELEKLSELDRKDPPSKTKRMHKEEDRSESQQDDLAKACEVVGKTDDFKQEDKNVKEIRNMRHRYKKRFGPKS